jgi:hypothetical protein
LTLTRTPRRHLLALPAAPNRRDRPRIVYNCLHVGLPRQLDETPDLEVAGQFAGDEDVRNSVRDQDLGFRECRTRHADGSGILLTARQNRALMVLVMRAQPGWADAEEARHLCQIALHDIQIEQERRCINFVQFHMRRSAGLEFRPILPISCCWIF